MRRMSARNSLVIALTVTLGALSQPVPAAEKYASKRMSGGRRWMTRNLAVPTTPSYCYGDVEANCGKYGRLYTWQSAREACAAVGWRLPTDGEWRELARRYGGVSADGADKGKSAFRALLAGGKSGFGAVLGGGRDPQGEYARGNAHGFYWTASEDAEGGFYYNFGAGGQALHRQSGGEKPRAFSVRCVRD